MFATLNPFVFDTIICMFELKAFVISVESCDVLKCIMIDASKQRSLPWNLHKMYCYSADALFFLWDLHFSLGTMELQLWTSLNMIGICCTSHTGGRFDEYGLNIYLYQASWGTKLHKWTSTRKWCMKFLMIHCTHRYQKGCSVIYAIDSCSSVQMISGCTYLWWWLGLTISCGEDQVTGTMPRGQ